MRRHTHFTRTSRYPHAEQWQPVPPRAVERRRLPLCPFGCFYCARTFAALDALVAHREACGPTAAEAVR